MNSLYDLAAPAKLNLFLHITGRRADGYHTLQSVFMLIDWIDTLHIELRPSSAISREDLGARLPDNDLCLRAARMLQDTTGCSQGAHISINKSIPSEAGMGGGSSDAATTFIALNKLWKLGLTRPQLAQIGLRLGADVPFFLLGQNAWVQGIGEDLSAVDLPPARFVVCKPLAGLSTATIFQHPALKRDSQPAIIEGFTANPYHFGRNDLQHVAQDLCSDVTQALTHLQAQGLTPRMTGSGSAVFAVLEDATSHPSLRNPPEGWQQRVCASLSEHPLRYM